MHISFNGYGESLEILPVVVYRYIVTHDENRVKKEVRYRHNAVPVGIHETTNSK